jgi:hypothetical protein
VRLLTPLTRLTLILLSLFLRERQEGRRAIAAFIGLYIMMRDVTENPKENGMA